MSARIRPFVFVAAVMAVSTQNLCASTPGVDGGALRPATFVYVAHPDSLASLLRILEPKVAPVTTAIDSLVGVLRADSGTVRADSAFIGARQTLQRLVWAIRAHEDSVFDRIAEPVGARAGRDPPAARDIAAADSLKRYLAARGMWVYTGEGSSYIGVSELALFRRLGHFLTESMQEYQRMLIDEQASPTMDDASLMISWDSLADRLARTEEFLVAHPNAAASADVTRRYDEYLRWYMRGSENTNAFDWRTCVLDFEVHRSYERYAAEHGSMMSGKVIRGYLEVLRRNRFQYGVEVRKYLLANADWSPRARGCRGK